MMKESADRLKHLYGSPASSEQIKIYFSTLLKTYLEYSERYSSDLFKKFNWYSRRPLKFVFYSDATTVCFSLVGKSNKEGVEQVSDVSKLTPRTQEGEVFITSSTSLNGQKLYSIDSAVREAILQHKLELKETEIPSIKNTLESARKEFEKNRPNVNKLKDQYNMICKSFNNFSELTNIDKTEQIVMSPFGRLNACPLVDSFVKRLDKVEEIQKTTIHNNKILKESFDTFKANTNDSIDRLRERHSYNDKIKANRWVVAGVILSFFVGLGSLIYQFFFSSGGSG